MKKLLATLLCILPTVAYPETEASAADAKAAVKGKVTWGELDANRSPVNARIPIPSRGRNGRLPFR